MTLIPSNFRGPNKNTTFFGGGGRDEQNDNFPEGLPEKFLRGNTAPERVSLIRVLLYIERLCILREYPRHNVFVNSI